MKTYLVRIEGINFLFRSPEELGVTWQRVGFFATRYVDAINPEEAGEVLRRRILTELPSNVSAIDSAGRTSQLLIEWAREVGEVDDSVVTTGFSFYPADDAH